MEKTFSQRLDECVDLADIFELVKAAGEEVLGRSRAGLMLGLANMGGSRRFFLGAYYPVDSNMIVVNSFPLKMIKEKNPVLFKPYIFHILLHEYLHSLNYLDEGSVRELTYIICSKLFGKEHLTAKMSKDISKFMPQLADEAVEWVPEKEPQIFVVEGFDKGHLTYVS
ncbi:MAG: hypothetical protein V1494_03940 [Candidatus Diapherotrites archaeon]